MLQTLRIKNVALIDEVTLNFDKQLNVISGETGAGKSIMLDSLSFVFGGRADKSLIRTGCASMKVEAIFSNLNISDKEFVKQEIGAYCDDEIFISRELDLNGKNTCKINGELTPVSTVKKVCSRLIDLHGQSEHLAILNNEYQLQIIDLFGKNIGNDLEELSNLISQLKFIEKQIHELGGTGIEKQNLIDLYSYQIQEIENANIKNNEFEELSLEKKQMQQYERIVEKLNEAKQSISGGGFDDSVINKISNSQKSMAQISELDENYLEVSNRLKSVEIELDDIKDSINSILNNLYFDEERFSYVDERLDMIKSLFRKYGEGFEKLNEYYNEISLKLDNLKNSEEKLNKLLLEKENKLSEIQSLQEKISEKRKSSAQILKEKMQTELKTLGMPNAQIDIEFSKIEEDYSLMGIDRVEFMFSANLGFEMKPLNKVVSGGEMSRVMLAYKIVVSTVDDIHTIIFDEIDTGLSGNIATVVAEYLARLSLTKQIIAVSHLPQICAMADQNIKVEKFSDEQTTHTRATYLNDEKLYLEIARLMGVEINDNGILASKQLKEKYNNYKLNLKNK